MGESPVDQGYWTKPPSAPKSISLQLQQQPMNC